jgi:MFS family permease
MRTAIGTYLPSQTSTPSRLPFILGVLLAINLMNFYDRTALSAVNEPLKKAWDLSDRQVGALGTSFILLYAVVGVPLGRWADTGRRTTILALGIALWSLFTIASGLAWGFWSLFVLRLCVGVGEASCAPAANSLLGDLVEPQRRARAVSVFMLGLPLGLGLSFLISGHIARLDLDWGWRLALVAAGLPGLVLTFLVLKIQEPTRGAAELRAARTSFQPGASMWVLFRIPTFWWIIISGALHNFNMYALTTFISPFLIRYHQLSLTQASWILALIYGFGGLGILLGGWACDWLAKRRRGGRLEVATLALLVFAPCLFLALQCQPGDSWGFTLYLLPACMLSYVYYSGVYATLQDLVEPELRGTAMALYFCAMYLLGAAPGPFVTGWISDIFARQAMNAEGTKVLTDSAKAIGLYHAMYIIPILACALVFVLFAASRTVTADQQRLRGKPAG